MKIDIHTHILPENWPDLQERYGYGGFVRIEHHQPCRARMMIGDKPFREIEDNCWSPARRIEDCDRCGVDVQVLSTVPVMFSYWARPEHAYDLSRLLNDHIAKVCADHSGRFLGFGTIPMQAPDLAIKEMERCVLPPQKGGLGLCGVEIGTHVDANEHLGRAEIWNLNEAALFPIFEAAERLGAAVFVHPWDMMGKERMPSYWLPWLVGMPAETSLAICSMIFGGVFERLPNLRVAFAHGGGAFPFTIGRIEHGFNCRPDLVAVDNKTNPRAYLAQPDGRPARFYVDSLVHDADALRNLLKLFGPRRVCLGSDYPFPLGEPVPGSLVDSMADLSAETKESIFSGAAREFLNLTAVEPASLKPHT